MRRRITSIIVSVAIAVAFMPTLAFADEPEHSGECGQQAFGIGTVVEQQEEIADGESAMDDAGDGVVIDAGDQGTVDVEEPAGAEPEQIDRMEVEEETPSYDIGDHTFNLSCTKYFYDGDQHKPIVTSGDLIEGADFEIEYEYYDSEYEEWYPVYDGEFHYAGKYRVVITGIAPYTGSVTLKYSIVVTSISLSKTSAKLYRKGTLKLKATVKNPNGKTTYSSSNKKVAVVSSGGKVTAKAKGTATITVKNGYAKKTVKVTVRNPKLNASTAKLYLKGTKKLKITGKVGKARFKSSNKKIATVTSSGKIKAKKKGKCTITVKTNGITLKCKVTVKKPSLNKKKVTIIKGKTAQLKITGKVGKAKFKSSNKKIATVTSSGKIKAKKKGKCTITVKTNGITLKCKVTVKNPPPTYVYITRTGERYHCDKDCWGLTNARAVYKVTLSKAKRKGLTKCHVCYW